MLLCNFSSLILQSAAGIARSSSLALNNLTIKDLLHFYSTSAKINITCLHFAYFQNPGDILLSRRVGVGECWPKSSQITSQILNLNFFSEKRGVWEGKGRLEKRRRRPGGGGGLHQEAQVADRKVSISSSF